jgi:predicted nucleic acid-binding protein
MTGERFLIDTVYVQALLSPKDQHHARALALLPRVRDAAQILVTEAVLIEIADGLCARDRLAAVSWIEACYRTPNVRMIPVDSELLLYALNLYKSRSDKTWSLTDCISFTVMQENGLNDALTADRHFLQAGFRAMMLTEP